MTENQSFSEFEYLLENHEIKSEFMELIKRIVAGLIDIPFETFSKMVRETFINYSSYEVKSLQDQYMHDALKIFREELSSKIIILQKDLPKDYNYIINRLQGYKTANKTQLFDLLDYMVKTNNIGGFSRCKNDRHLSDFKCLDVNELRAFLIKENIEDRIKYYQKINLIPEEIRKASEELYLKLWKIDLSEWDSTKKLPKKMVAIEKKFIDKKMLNYLPEESYGSIHFHIEVKIPDHFKKLFHLTSINLTHLNNLQIAMREDSYELRTYAEIIPLTDELIEFLLSFGS